MSLSQNTGQLLLEGSSESSDACAAILEAWDKTLDTVTLVDLDMNPDGSITSPPELDNKIDRCIAFKWGEGDNDDENWYPQGITGSYDAVGGNGCWGRDSLGTNDDDPDGRKLLLVSWYCRDEETYGQGNGLPYPQGVRISVVDLTEWKNPIKYRHILLVEPTLDEDGALDFHELTYVNSSGATKSVHAGGIAWYGRYLYVADGEQLHVFDLGRIKEVDDSEDSEDVCGRVEDGSSVHYYALGYRYV